MPNQVPHSYTAAAKRLENALAKAAKIMAGTVTYRGYEYTLARALIELWQQSNAAPQVPHGVCRADDPNREANEGAGALYSPPQAAAPSASPRAIGVAPSVSDDSAGTRIPAVAAHQSRLAGPSGGDSVGPWKECVYKHPDAPKGEGYPGIAHDLETLRYALRKLHDSKAMNAWGHMIVRDALAAIAQPPATTSPLIPMEK